MAFWRRKTPVLPRRKRLQGLPLPELYNWTESLLYQTGRHFSTWRRGGGEVALDEAEKHIQALLEVCNEIRARERLQL